jgi:hypothetical protein
VNTKINEKISSVNFRFIAICFGDKTIQVTLDGRKKAIRVLLEIGLDLQIYSIR